MKKNRNETDRTTTAGWSPSAAGMVRAGVVIKDILQAFSKIYEDAENEQAVEEEESEAQ